MAIKGSRSESIQDSIPSGSRTGLIEWINNGTVSLESNQPVGVANEASLWFGRALNASNDRTARRIVNPTPNDRFRQT